MGYVMKKVKKVNKVNKKVIDIDRRDDLNRLNELSGDLQKKINELINTVASHKYDQSVEKLLSQRLIQTFILMSSSQSTSKKRVSYGR